MESNRFGLDIVRFRFDTLQQIDYPEKPPSLLRTFCAVIALLLFLFVKIFFEPALFCSVDCYAVNRKFDVQIRITYILPPAKKKHERRNGSVFFVWITIYQCHTLN